MSPYPKAFLFLAVAAVTLSACGGSPAVEPTAPAGTVGSAPAAGGQGDAGRLCDFLRSEIPVLQGVGSEVGRLAQLTGHLYTWGEEQKIVGKMDVEALTKQSCPDVRAEVLTLIGEDSFANVF